MQTVDPMTIVQNAVSRGELDKLLLGTTEYRYRSKWSPAPGDTDLTELLAVLCDRWNPTEKERINDDLTRALYAVVGTYEGLEPVATFILFESGRKADGDGHFGVPLDRLSAELQSSIKAYSGRLRSDKSGAGRNWPDGWLGELRRLSRVTDELGGPSFLD